MERRRALRQERTAKIESMEWDDVRVHKGLRSFAMYRKKMVVWWIIVYSLSSLCLGRVCTRGRERSIKCVWKGFCQFNLFCVLGLSHGKKWTSSCKEILLVDVWRSTWNSFLFDACFMLQHRINMNPNCLLFKLKTIPNLLIRGKLYHLRKCGE